MASVTVAGFVGLLWIAQDRVRETAERNQSNLSRIALAFHNYHEVNGHLPAAVLYSPSGIPLHSWRVLILPYIEQKDLYDQFRLDEPWDSPHNIKLLEKMPSTYAAQGSKKTLPAFHTVCHVFVGKGTPFERGKIVRLKDNFPDGTSNTILFVEAAEPVPWTKPEDIPYDPEAPLLPLKGLFEDGFRACMSDGSGKFFRYDTSEEKLRAAITRNEGEPLGSNW
jgi:hypothetical protein